MEPNARLKRLNEKLNKEIQLGPTKSISGLRQKSKISRVFELRNEIFFTSLLLFSACTSQTDQSSAPPPAEEQISEEQEPPSETKFITLPLEVYLYDFQVEPDYSSTLNEEDVADLVAKANEIYAQAEIKFNVVSVTITRIPAEMFDITIDPPETTTSTVKKFSKIVPPYDANKIVWRTGIVRKMPIPAGGLYAAKLAFFAEQNKDGEFHHTIFAHELGHSLGLDHTEIPGNLMTVGNAAVALKLNSEQIEKMRAQALIGPK
jgi:hypothetical protein